LNLVYILEAPAYTQHPWENREQGGALFATTRKRLVFSPRGAEKNKKKRRTYRYLPTYLPFFGDFWRFSGLILESENVYGVFELVMQRNGQKRD
jgi:hypothetical protein